MLHLTPMRPAEYEFFMELSMQEQAEGHVKQGHWTAEEAETNMLKLRDQFLPQGLETPGHFFFTLETVETAEKVGSLWITVNEHEGEKAFFVMDIQINPDQRRKGYGSEAFQLMEEKAREMGINTITLHVFKENAPARAMYEKLGFTGPCDMMVKKI